MKPSLKTAAWITLAIIAAGVVAAPKVLPALHSGKAEKLAADSPQKAPDKGKVADDKNARSALAVATFVVERAPFAELVNSTGTLRAEESVELQAEINGKVVAINFVEGA